ncbi:MAG: Rne/Rng family ribonuclease [Thermoanaerobaculia bacterium]
MTRRMLINAQNSEELRIALVDGTTLESFQLEASERGLTRGNIYRGLVVNLQPSLNAAFIDYGAERHGFLSSDNVVEQAWHRHPDGGRRPRIEQILERGRPIMVQVTKDPEGQKGAALTTNLSLAGRYLVLTPYDDTRGVSRKVEDDEVRQRLKDQVDKMNLPAGGGFIVRTNALEQTKATMSRDFAALLRLWKRIEADGRKGDRAKLLYNDQDIIVRAMRDYLDATVEEVVIDDEAAFAKAEEYIRSFMPRGKTRLMRYADRVPLFSKFDIEPQIDRIYDRTVPLPSGGSIVIDRTEALVAIDVNSGKSTRASSQEETAVHTNLEAAKEVARQLKLRDIGGLVVVDFIDMRHRKDRAQVEKTLKDALKNDKARTSVNAISPNGLLEINRQKIQQALALRTHRPCPTCDGTGRIASPEMVSVNLLRRIEARAASGRIERVRIALHPELADAFQNHRRADIARLEEEFGISVEVIASYRLHRPEQEVEWVERTHSEPRPAEPRAAEARAPHAPPLPRRTSAPEARPESGRPRKRRRGKGRHGAEDAAKDRELLVPLPQEEWISLEPVGQDEAPAPNVSGSPEPIGGTAPRKRRRSRRRRGGGAELEPHAPPVAVSQWVFLDDETAADSGESDEQRSPEPAPEMHAADQPVAPQPVHRRRSRRGGKRRNGGAAAALKPATETSSAPSIEASDVPLSGAVGGAVHKRRSRRGGRRRHKGPAPEGGGSAPPQ